MTPTKYEMRSDPALAKLSDHHIKKIKDFARYCMRGDEIAALLNISESSWNKWFRVGLEQREACDKNKSHRMSDYQYRCLEIVRAFKLGLVEVKSKLIGNIINDEDWRSSAWVLEHYIGFRDEFSLKQNIEHSVKDSEGIENSKERYLKLMQDEGFRNAICDDTAHTEQGDRDPGVSRPVSDGGSLEITTAYPGDES